MTWGRRAALQRELDELEALPSLTPNQIQREHEVIRALAWYQQQDAELAEATERDRQEREEQQRYAEAYAEQRALTRPESAAQEARFQQALQLRDQANGLLAGAPSPSRPERPMLAEALQSVEAKAADAGLDPAALTVKETAELLAAAGVRPRVIRRWRVGQILGHSGRKVAG